MNSATRVLAVIAMGGAVAGAAVAVSQVPAPQSAAAVAASGPGATEAVQQLADETTQLHVAIASAQTQLEELHANVVAPSPSPDLAALLAQANSQLAIARQRLAADEALLATLQAVGHAQHPRATAPTPTPARRALSDTPSSSPASRESVEPTLSAAPPTQLSAAPPTQQPTRSPSARPTNRGGDD